MARRGKGEGTIYRRTDGRWAAQVTVAYDQATGRQRRKTFYGKTRAEVAEKLKSAPKTVTGGHHGRTVAEACDEWYAEKSVTVAETTAAHYRPSVARIKALLGDVPLSRLRPSNVSALYAAVAQKAGTATVRKVAKCLKAVLKRAVRLGQLASSPAALVPLPRHEAGAVAAWTLADLRAILREASALRDGCLVWLAADTGARIGELLALTDKDVDLGRGEVHIQRSLRPEGGTLQPRSTKTRAGRRRVPLGDGALAALKAHLTSARRQERLRTAGPAARAGAVFLTRTGGWWPPQRAAKMTYAAAVKRAGLPHKKFHSLRHTAASLLLAANVHPKVVQERLGHARIEVTLQTYSHLLPTSQDAAARAMSEAVAVPQQSEGGEG